MLQAVISWLEPGVTGGESGEQPGAVLGQQSSFSFPSHVSRADAAGHGVLMRAEESQTQSFIARFWSKSHRLQSWSGTGKPNCPEVLETHHKHYIK